MRRQILGVLSTSKAEQLLLDLANDTSQARMFARHPEILMGDVSGPTCALMNSAMLAQMRRYLRNAWDTVDPRLFDWSVWSAQSFYFTELLLYEQRGVPAKKEDLQHPDLLFLLKETPPKEVTPVEAALFYFRHNRRRALHCPNPDCPAPYFFASKKGQKYCSEACARPAQQASKRRWWAENRGKSKRGGA